MRIDLATSEWHHLVRPVLAHTLKDPDFPELSQVRIEVGDVALYAAATDRYTLGAERRPLARVDRHQRQQPVHVRASDIKASLAQFPFTKDDDPPLTLIVDTVSVSAEVLGETGSYTTRAVTLSSPGGKVVMHDRRITGRDPLEGWRRLLSSALGRQQGGTLSGLDLNPGHLGRWKDAVRAGERLTFWTGPKRKDPILVTVEDHFAGLWLPLVWGEGDGAAPADPAGLPWLTELDAGIDLRTAAGLLTADPGTGDEP